jgi:hypothetical protein
MSDYLLYGTEGCHLCEDAEQLLLDAGLAFSKQDIIEDPQLLQNYGVLIPVLLHSASQQQLNWPFDSQALQDFIKNNRL